MSDGCFFFLFCFEVTLWFNRLCVLFSASLSSSGFLPSSSSMFLPTTAYVKQEMINNNNNNIETSSVDDSTMVELFDQLASLEPLGVDAAPAPPSLAAPVFAQSSSTATSSLLLARNANLAGSVNNFNSTAINAPAFGATQRTFGGVDSFKKQRVLGASAFMWSSLARPK